jgi:hypothetical protein
MQIIAEFLVPRELKTQGCYATKNDLFHSAIFVTRSGANKDSGVVPKAKIKM